MVLIESSVFGRPAATFESCRDRRRLDETFRPDVFRHEIGMLAQSIARPLDLDDGRMVKKAVKQSGRDHGVSKNMSPFGKSAIGGQDHGALFVTGVDELKEEIAAAWHDWEVADLVDDEQGEAAEELDFLTQNSLAFCLGEGADDIGEAAEIDAASGLHGFDAERQAQVAFAGSGRPDQMQGLGAVDELQLGERHDAVPSLKKWARP